MSDASVATFETIQISGVLKGLKELVCRYFAEHGPCSQVELLRDLAKPGENTGRYTGRIPELMRLGVIRAVGEKVSSETGHRVTLYEATGKVLKAQTLKQRLKLLGCDTLEEYYRTEHWLIFVQSYFTRHEKKCWVTGGVQGVQLHHLNYDTLGEESDDDVVPLARPVHERVHMLNKEFGIPINKGHLVIKALLTFSSSASTP